MPLSHYLKIYPSVAHPDHFLLFSTLRSSTVIVPAATLKAAQDDSLTGQGRETLQRLGMLVADPAAEREQVRMLLKNASEKSRSFKVTAVLNLDCNLDCGYCYEGLFRGQSYMSDDTAELLVDMLRHRMSEGMDVAVTFYGGEPLLSQDLIRKISVPLNEAARNHNVSYGFGMVTNGTLLNRATAEALLPFGFRGAKFTLDGPREIHDRQRPFASGSGSFDTIVDNMVAVCDLIEVQLGGNCYEDNYREFPRVLDHLIDCGITPDKLSRILFVPITPQAGCADHNSGCLTSSSPWLIEALPWLREEIMKRGFATSKTSASACVVEFPNTLIVNYDGSLFKCPAFMGNQDLSVGTLATGIKDYSESHAVGNWQTEECLDCSYLPLCFGGCRFLTQLQGKPLSELDCKREFFDATLEKMILQNIAYPRPKKPADKPQMNP